MRSLFVATVFLAVGTPGISTAGIVVPHVTIPSINDLDVPDGPFDRNADAGTCARRGPRPRGTRSQARAHRPRRELVRRLPDTGGRDGASRGGRVHQRAL